MNYLIDTHILLWWIFNDPKLDRQSREIVANPNHTIWVSSASAWKIATKYRIGKLPEAKELLDRYDTLLTEANFRSLSITAAHALRAGTLPIAHRDPFDRMLMAQAQLEQMPIVTHDRAFRQDFLTTISP
jgi:PIN domain nuclease of toxin-antitoxin system